LIQALYVLDNWFIFRKGDEGDEMYFIKSGQVEICGDNGIVFVTLSTGAFFGEIALFEACRRTASARAKGHVELCTLHKDDFNLIMDTYPDIAEKIRQTIRERKENEQRMKDQKAAEEAAKKEREAMEAELKEGKTSVNKISRGLSVKLSSIAVNAGSRVSTMGRRISGSIMSLSANGGGNAPSGAGGGAGSLAGERRGSILLSAGVPSFSHLNISSTNQESDDDDILDGQEQESKKTS
jgi:CRP-like cAMP-binding protein